MRLERGTVLMTAVVASAVLAMAACGSSQKPANLTSAGGATSTATTSAAASTPSTAASSSATPTAAGSSSPAANGLPDLTLPADVTLQFNMPKTGDAAKDAALAGLAQAETAKYKATELGVSGGPVVDDFFIGNGNNGVKQYLVRKVSSGQTVTGTNVYYDWKFTQSNPDNKGFQITYCEDQNKFFGKSRTSGQQVPQPAGLAQILSLKVDMIVDKDGRWKAGFYSWTTGDVTCQAAEGH